jgi:DNA mismatch repair protein MutS2
MPLAPHIPGLLQHHSADALEFPRLRSLVAGYAQSAPGRDWTQSLAPSNDLPWLSTEHALVAEARSLIRAGSNFSFAGLTDASPLLERARIAGSALDPADLLVCAQLAHHLAGWSALLRNPPALRTAPEPGAPAPTASTPTTLPHLTARSAGLLDAHTHSQLTAIVIAVHRAINPDGSIADDASPDLRRIRRDIDRQKKLITDSLNAALRKLIADGGAQEELITIRGDRFVLPVKADHKRRVPGVVHGASSTGQTIFVEPLETIEQNNDLVRLHDDELEEIHRILAALTAQIATVADPLLTGLTVLAEADSLFARARFAAQYECVAPEFSADTFSLTRARHPLLEDRLRRNHATAIIPTELAFPPNTRQLVISGPNTGGKSVALKTAGILALMAQAGIPVPAAHATLPLFGAVLADIGDAQSIEQDLSSFSAHIKSIEHIAALAAQTTSLVLLDEPGTATDPEEGSALAVAFAQHFLAAGAWSILSTHHTSLKIYAANTPGAANAAVGFDEATLSPTYTLRIGVPGASAGINIAARLGLAPEIVAAARARLTTQQQDIAGLLTQLHTQLDAANEERASLREQQQLVARERSRLELHGKNEQRQKVRELESKLDALIKDFESRVRENLRELSDRAAQQKLTKDSDRRVARARNEFREQFNQAVVAATTGADRSDPNATPHIVANVNAGDTVRLRSLGQTARIARQLDDNSFEASIGNMKMRVNRADIVEVIAAASPLDAARSQRNVRVTTAPRDASASSTEINVIGQNVDEAQRIVERFLDQAFLSGAQRIRIVHGTGMGILRRELRAWLRTQPHVTSITEPPHNLGGTGVTEVELDV